MPRNSVKKIQCFEWFHLDCVFNWIYIHCLNFPCIKILTKLIKIGLNEHAQRQYDISYKSGLMRKKNWLTSTILCIHSLKKPIISKKGVPLSFRCNSCLRLRWSEKRCNAHNTCIRLYTKSNVSFIPWFQEC